MTEPPANPPKNSYAQWSYERACARKRVYETMHAASSSALTKNHRDREQGLNNRWTAYGCRFCAKFHLTCEKDGKRST